MDTLAEFVKERREAVGLTVTGLASAAGLSKSEISAIEKGRIALPGADKRRALAVALGVRHIDLLVAAGELRLDELPVEGAPRDLFPSETDIRREVLAALERVSPDTDLKRRILRSVVGTLEELEKPEPFA